MAIDIETRRERVANGSRRKRDLRAVGITPTPRPRERWQRDAERSQRAAAEEAQRLKEREQRLLPKVKETPEAGKAWAAAVDEIRAVVPDSTFRLWLEPLRCLGEAEGALYITAPAGIRAWVERRYAKSVVGRFVREVSGYRGVFLMPIPDAEAEEDDGCL